MTVVDENSFSLKILFMPPDITCGAVSAYRVFLRSGTTDRLDSFYTNIFTMDGLQSYTNYTVRIAAINVAGSGPFSSPQLVQTEQAG